MSKYFAAMDKEEIVKELDERENEWFRHLHVSGLYSAMRRAYKAYYGENDVTKNGKITSVGEAGELKAFISNEFRNFLLHIHNLTTQSKINYQPRATNSDAKSLQQSILSKSILDYYSRERDVQSFLSEATEYGIATTEAFIKLDWREYLGETVFMDKKSGDVEYRVFQGMNVARDFTKQSYKKNQWYILREKVNKYDLAAKYPELEEGIIKLSNTDENSETRTFFDDHLRGNTTSDDIYIKEFWHEKSPALPQGRLVIYLSGSKVLYDGPLPYNKTHLYRLAPQDFLGTTHGYSVAIDLLPLQENLDALMSAAADATQRFLGQIIAVKKGDGFSMDDIGGTKVVEYLEAPPVSLDFSANTDPALSLINNILQRMGTISAINEVIRGQTPEGVTAGNALALIQAQAIQFNNNLARAYAKLSEDVGTGTLDLLKQFADSPRTIFILGENNRGKIQSFKKEDISSVSRVVVEVVNPIESTYQGRKALSDEWVQKGLLTPQKQLIFMRTGNLEAETQGIESEYMLIKQENEALARGETVPVVVTELHMEHLQEHRSVLSSLEAKSNPLIIQAALSHIQEHLNMLRTADPQMLQAFNQPSLQAPPAPAPQGGAAPGPIEANNPPAPNAPPADLPNPPTDPATGQPAQIPQTVLPQG